MQASEDYHAIVTALRGSGYFNGQWLATGTSKSGIASALYAYYSEKKGYNDRISTCLSARPSVSVSTIPEYANTST
jgi:hypothetical protein